MDDRRQPHDLDATLDERISGDRDARNEAELVSIIGRALGDGSGPLAAMFFNRTVDAAEYFWRGRERQPAGLLTDLILNELGTRVSHLPPFSSQCLSRANGMWSSKNVVEF